MIDYSYIVLVNPVDSTRMDLVIPGEQHMYLKAATSQERQQWLVALGSAKACVNNRTRKESSESVVQIACRLHILFKFTLLACNNQLLTIKKNAFITLHVYLFHSNGALTTITIENVLITCGYSLHNFKFLSLHVYSVEKNKRNSSG